MKRFQTAKSHNFIFHGVRIPKGAVYGQVGNIEYYCDRLYWKSLKDANNKQYYQLHIHVWNDNLQMWESGRNNSRSTLVDFVANRIRRFGLRPKSVEYSLEYKSAGVLPQQKMPQSYKGYQYRVGGRLNSYQMTDADACRPYRFNDEYGIKA